MEDTSTRAEARMVGMRMGDDRARRAGPRIDVKIAGGAIEPAVGRNDEVQGDLRSTRKAVDRPIWELERSALGWNPRAETPSPRLRGEGWGEGRGDLPSATNRPAAHPNRLPASGETGRAGVRPNRRML
jgi:hypothetical protein